MRSRPVLFAAPLLLGPGVLACFSGGFFDTARLRAGVLAWLLLALVAAGTRRPLPAGGPGRLALGGLAALTALTGLSLLWAPLAGPASDDLQRLPCPLSCHAARLNPNIPGLVRGRCRSRVVRKRALARRSVGLRPDHRMTLAKFVSGYNETSTAEPAPRRIYFAVSPLHASAIACSSEHPGGSRIADSSPASQDRRT